jgi:hypothetical protein
VVLIMFKELQCFGMIDDEQGGRQVTHDEEPQYYDVVLSVVDDGLVDIIEEHDNLTLEQATKLMAKLAAEHPDADESWNS